MFEKGSLAKKVGKKWVPSKCHRHGSVEETVRISLGGKTKHFCPQCFMERVILDKISPLVLPESEK